MPEENLDGVWKGTYVFILFRVWDLLSVFMTLDLFIENNCLFNVDPFLLRAVS